MRVISMVPSWTETLIECGVEVVGRTRFCVHPQPQVKAIPVVGGTKDVRWDKVKGLGADLILLDQEENPRSMADETPLPYLSTHIRSVPDVARDLKILATKLSNSRIGTLAERWAQLSSRKIPPPRKIEDLPGVLEWIKHPSPKAKSLVYLIWHKPWMAVSRGTFIGSVLETLGYGNWMPSFDKPYPEIDLEKFDPEKTVLLGSTEPFPFAKKKDLLSRLDFPSAIVDGEAFSWFGTRSLKFLEQYLK